MKIRIIILGALSVLLLTSVFHLPSVFAAFKDPGFGTRPMGMGGAFCAVADDVNAALYNPAGVYITDTYSVGLMYAKLYAGLDDVNLGLQHAAFIMPTENKGNFGFTWAQFTSASDYREDTMILSYAKGFQVKVVPEFYAGINLKSMGHAYTLDERTIDDPVFADGNSKSALAIDLGAWAALTSNSENETALGLMLKNLNEPDVGLKTEDKVPSELRIGVKHSIAEMGSTSNFLIAADLSYRNQANEKEQNKVNIHIGSEAWFFDELLGLRAGGNMNSFGAGFSIKRAISSTVMQLDYSLLMPLSIEGTSGSHRMSVSCGF
ncbi:MAG: hypothetical protein ABII64_10060 [Elusimicrobiota bacterium]